MKRLLYILICVLLLCSCSNGAKQMETLKQHSCFDSIAKVKQDSINNALKPLSEYAWGDAKFGMTIEEARNTDALRDYSYSSGKDDVSYLIKAFSYPNNSPYKDVVVFFQHQRLYSVSIILDNIMYKYYDEDISGKLSIFKQMIETKYCAPMICNAIPNKKKITKEKSLIYQWDICDKTISISIVEFEKEPFIKLIRGLNEFSKSSETRQQGVPMRSIIYELSGGRDRLGMNRNDNGIYYEDEIENMENDFIRENKIFTLLCVIESDNEKRILNEYNDSINRNKIEKEDNFNLF